MVYETENFAHYAIETRKAIHKDGPSKFARDRIREAVAREDFSTAKTTAQYWANKFKCKVWATRPNVPFLILDKRDKYWNVLIGDRIGWIIMRPWLTVKEI
jgi:hypothetical protein